jgi:NAD(P) transhydrogenase
VIGAPGLAATSLPREVAMLHAFDVNFKAEIAPLLPIGIYTIPEASMVGETEESLVAKGVAFVIGRADYLEAPRGEIVGERNGLLKLLFRRDDMRLLGVHVIGEHATELAHLGLPALVLTFRLLAICIELRLTRLWRLVSRPGERNLPTKLPEN